MSTRTFVVGTAGHVDHGKSTLVKRLTGIDPDRLREEQEREMTIDLGFAWLTLPGGLSVSVVDVPGHERFIKNMLAGVGGIDAALLIVAADEGPMPQTAEHLAILDLLGITAGLVVLTKRDLVDDVWLELMTEETREALAGTTLADAPIVPVSALTGAGLPELLSELEALLLAQPERPTAGRPRLPVDRVFTVAGFGTVVTGTLVGDALETGQEVELLPGGLRSRVRGLQSHSTKVERARPGSRTAVNLTGVDREQLQRGAVLTTPGWLRPTTLLDARLRLIAAAPRSLEQNDAVDFFVGATEASARVTLLADERIEPGGEGWVQLRFAQPVVVVESDQFIIRQASPSLTIGGGVVINAHPRRHRRFREEVIEELDTRAGGTPLQRLLQALAEGPRTLRELSVALDIDAAEVSELVAEGVGTDDVIVLGAASDERLPPNRLVQLMRAFERQTATVERLLTGFQDRHRLRRGMPKEEVRSRLQLEARVFDALLQTLVRRGLVVDLGNVVASAGWRVELNADEQRRAATYLLALEASPDAPPAPGDFGLDAELLAAMEDQRMVVRLADNVVFGAEHLERVKAQTLALIDADGTLTLAQFRDHFGSSRKYAQAVLEYFDQQRVTRRVGDARVRGSG